MKRTKKQIRRPFFSREADMSNPSLDRGKMVEVNCFDGTRRRNIVWEIGERVVYLCSPRQYEAMRAGRAAPPPIGFPIRDVEPTV